VIASFQIFNEAGMPALRSKSLKLTAYLQSLLENLLSSSSSPSEKGREEVPDFKILTPLSPTARGAQLSLRLRPGLMESVFKYLDSHGVILDERKPDVIRVAPAPLYNSFVDVWEFCRIFSEGLEMAKSEKRGNGEGKNGVVVNGH
jgi:kynureninase